MSQWKHERKFVHSNWISDNEQITVAHVNITILLFHYFSSFHTNEIYYIKKKGATARPQQTGKVQRTVDAAEQPRRWEMTHNIYIHAHPMEIELWCSVHASSSRRKFQGHSNYQPPLAITGVCVTCRDLHGGVNVHGGVNIFAGRTVYMNTNWAMCFALINFFFSFFLS